MFCCLMKQCQPGILLRVHVTRNHIPSSSSCLCRPPPGLIVPLIQPSHPPSITRTSAQIHGIVANVSVPVALAHTRVRTVLEAPELHNCHDLGVPHGMGVIHEWRNGPTIRVAHLPVHPVRSTPPDAHGVVVPCEAAQRRPTNWTAKHVYRGQRHAHPWSPAKINVTCVSAVDKGTRESGGQTNVSPKNTSCGHRRTQVRRTRKHVPRTFLSSYPRPADPLAAAPRELSVDAGSPRFGRAFAQLLARRIRAAAAQSASRPRGCAAQAACAAAPRWLRRADCAVLLLSGCRRAAPRARGPTSS